MTVIPRVPSALTSLPNWLLWKLIQKENEPKPRKVPFYANGKPRSGAQGTPEDRGQLVTWDEAVRALQAGSYTGLGLALLPGAEVVALDFDNCVKDGVADPRVAALVAGTYAELSPSKTGLRAFMAGSLASRKDNADKADRNADGTRKDGKFDVEFFGDSGFVTVTGDVLEDCELLGFEGTVAPLSDEVLTLYRQRFGESALRVVEHDGDDDLLSLAAPLLGWSLDEARTILFACDANASRERWLKALMAMHHEFSGSPEALDLCDEWSSTGDSYGGRADVEGRWRSFGRGSSGGSVTGRWLLSWRKDCQVREKYAALDERRREIAGAVDEFTLRERICPDIQQDVRLDDMEREALAQALLQAFAKLGSKYPVAQCRKMIAEKRPEKKAGKSKPDWLEGWVYVSDDDKFFRVDSDEWLSMQGFNARFNRELQTDGEDFAGKTASWRSLEDLGTPTVTRATYLPWADQLFDLDGVTHVNTYRQSSIPIAAEHVSPEGRKAIEVVKRHISLICGGREPVIRTMIDWMAHNVQHAGVKVRWAPLIKGVEGDGKSVLGTLMAAVMGRTNVRNVSPKVLGTDFTGWAEGSCVAVLEEIKLTGHNRYDILNALKPFVTNDSVEIHRKGKDTYDAVNTTNYVAFTNYVDALPLTDTDRRWWIVFSPFLSASEMAAAVRLHLGVAGSDRDVLGGYFDELHHAIHACRADLRRWLLDWKISESFKPNGSAPMTEEKAVMVNMNVSDDEMSLAEILSRGAPGVTEQVFASSYLSAEVVSSGAEINVSTLAWNLLLKRMGYVRLPKKLKWRGKTEIIWVKGHKNWEPALVREVLDKTSAEEGAGSQSDDLF